MANDVKLGELITGTQYRDAVHIAIVPIVIGESLKPGEPVEFRDGETETAWVAKGRPIGIIDPFLPMQVLSRGTRCFMLLMPNTITSLRHEWTHPAFTNKSDKKIVAAKHQITRFAEEAGINYDEIMDAASAYLKHGAYLIEGGRWEGHYLADEFWDHYEVVTGTRIGDNERGSFFSCSC